jgi:hypothetical protein
LQVLLSLEKLYKERLQVGSKAIGELKQAAICGGYFSGVKRGEFVESVEFVEFVEFVELGWFARHQGSG